MKRFVLLLSLLGAALMLAGCAGMLTSATVIPYTGDVPAEKLCTLNIASTITVQTLDGKPVTWKPEGFFDSWVQVRVPAGTHVFTFDYHEISPALDRWVTAWSTKPLTFSYNFLAGREYSIMTWHASYFALFIKDATGQPNLGITMLAPAGAAGWTQIPVYITEDVSGREDRAAALRGAAEKGDAQAQFNLGEMYRTGEGVAQDYKEAAAWFRKAADQGLAQAQYDLGVMYHEGKGVAKDRQEAVAWYRRAAEQGFAKAQYNLGLMYDNGEGVAKDDKEAAAWFRKAADQGHAGARAALQKLQ